MIGTIVSFLGSSVFGSILGLVGNWLNQRMIRKNKELDQAHDLAMADMEIKKLQATTRASIELSKAQVEGLIDLKEAQTYETSIVVGNKRLFAEKWMDRLFGVKSWIRYITVPLGTLLMAFFALSDLLSSFIRPVLTISFTAAYGWVAYTSYHILKSQGFDGMTIDQAMTYWTLCVDACIMFTFMCGSWWFGDRRMAKSGQEMIKNKRKMERDNSNVNRVDDVDVTIS